MPSSLGSDAPLTDRRTAAGRRAATERRGGDRRQGLTLVTAERRAGQDRRRPAERRSVAERRAEESAIEHIRHAFKLIAQVADADQLDDEQRRDLDAALFRLRFAIDRLEAGRAL
jgi:hypothetical protein